MNSPRQDHALLTDVLKELRSLENHLTQLRIVDSLTSLPTRLYLHATLQEAIDVSTQRFDDFSCLFINFDLFDAVNETYGRSFGDAVLTAFANRLKRHLRTTDQAFYYGGDAFFVLLHKTSINGAVAVARRLMELCRKVPFCENGIFLVNTVSIGVTSFALARPTVPEDLILTTEQMLHMAKLSGRNKFAAGYAGLGVYGEPVLSVPDGLLYGWVEPEKRQS